MPRHTLFKSNIAAPTYPLSLVCSMPTYQELAKQYAAQIKSAAANEPLRSVKSVTIGEASRSSLAAVLRSIGTETRDVLRTELNENLNEDQRTRLHRLIAEELGLYNWQKFDAVIKSCTNDNFNELVGYWEIFTQELNKR